MPLKLIILFSLLDRTGPVDSMSSNVSLPNTGFGDTNGAPWIRLIGVAGDVAAFASEKEFPSSTSTSSKQYGWFGMFVAILCVNNRMNGHTCWMKRFG